MKSVRQIEAAEHLIAGASFATSFAKSLLAVTRPELLVGSPRTPTIAATTAAARASGDCGTFPAW